MKSQFKLLLLTATLFQLAVCQAAPQLAPTLPQTDEDLVEVRCLVDSGVYNRPMLKGPGKNVPVPLPDGAQVTIFKSSTGISKIEISPGPRFRMCHEKTHEISDIDRAKSLVEFTQIENPDAFLGTELAICRTVDEGWYFLLGKKTGYIGYAGPMEKPLAFVGMACD